jgi:hypothetical protein
VASAGVSRLTGGNFGAAGAEGIEGAAVGLFAILDKGLWWVCLSSCNRARPMAKVRELGLNILTFRWISSFNPTVKATNQEGLAQRGQLFEFRLVFSNTAYLV